MELHNFVLRSTSVLQSSLCIIGELCRISKLSGCLACVAHHLASLTVAGVSLVQSTSTLQEVLADY